MNAFDINDTIGQRVVLEKWEKEKPADAELFTGYFNYYFKLYQLKGDQDFLKAGVDRINKGIELYPDRLDMRFGKIYMYGVIKDWDNFTKSIINAVDHSSKNKNEWFWRNNEKKENGKEFFLGILQNYQVQLYNTNDNALLLNMRAIANAVLEYYPDDVVSLSNLSSTYILTGEYEKGIASLLKAEKLAPRDPVVLNNLARAYQYNGEKEKAIQYYEETIRYADEKSAELLKHQIEELKNRKDLTK